MRCERLGRAGLADQARSKVQGRAGLPLLRAPHCAPPPALVKCSRLVGWLVGWFVKSKKMVRLAPISLSTDCFMDSLLLMLISW